MGASVRIEDEAFSCERYEDLAVAAGLADSDHARGKMARLWRQCTIENTPILGNQVVIRVLGPNGIQALIEARLGDMHDEKTMRIRGTTGRIEWLAKVRENGRKGGRPKGKAPKPSGYGDRKAPGYPNRNPPAPVPVPIPTPVPTEIIVGAASPAKPTKRKPTKVVLPDGWEPNQAHSSKASEGGVDLAKEHEKFKNDALAKSKTFANWDAAFHNWLTNAIDWKRPPSVQPLGVKVGRVEPRLPEDYPSGRIEL